MDTKEQIEKLHIVWTNITEPVDFSREFELITQTLEALKGVPSLCDPFKTVAERVGLASETSDWKVLREAALMSLSSMLKRYEESRTRRTVRPAPPRTSIYGR